MLIIGIYGGLFLTYKGYSAFKKKPAPIAAAPATHSHGSDEIPSADSAAFDAWISEAGSVEKLLDSLAK